MIEIPFEGRPPITQKELKMPQQPNASPPSKASRLSARARKQAATGEDRRACLSPIDLSRQATVRR